MLLTALLAGCLPTTSTTEQDLCTIQDQANGNCPGQEGCTPLDYCTNADFAAGTCCIHYNHPAQPTVVGQVHCGTDPTSNDQPICISQNDYDFGVLKIKCVTVTRWYRMPDGTVFSQQETSCTFG